jgi:ribose transport system ATP-binding protein
MKKKLDWMYMKSISLQTKNIVKRFGGVVALREGNLEVNSGEVVALVGANGSGKSTLTKIITGVLSKDEGEIFYNDIIVEFPDPLASKKEGITAVYQELSLVPSMTVAENIWLAQEPLTKTGRIDYRKTIVDTRKLLKLFEGTFQTTLTPEAAVEDLPPDEKQIVEILKAISQNPDVIILDEATASLDSRQVECLFNLVKEWKQEGKALVFVSHRMDEIFRIADRAVVLRNGATVGSVMVAETDETEIVSMMVGHESGLGRVERVSVEVEEMKADAIVVTGLKNDVLAGVDFTVKAGELVGIGGLRGQGQSTLLHAIFGNKRSEGTITLFGEEYSANHPYQAMKKDIALVPGDRSTQGVLMIRSIFENLHLPNWRAYGRFLDLKKAERDADDVADQLNMVMESLESPINSLSGGNAQKVVIGKWLLRNPQILLLDDPTKGVDVGTKAEFYNLLDQLAAAGTTILFYSSDDQELMDLCPRILVMQDGFIKADLIGESLTKSNLIATSMGADLEVANNSKAKNYE